MSSPVWLLGTELASSARVVSALTSELSVQSLHLLPKPHCPVHLPSSPSPLLRTLLALALPHMDFPVALPLRVLMFPTFFLLTSVWSSSRHFKLNVPLPPPLISTPEVESTPFASQQMQGSSQHPDVSPNSSDLPPLFLPAKSVVCTQQLCCSEDSECILFSMPSITTFLLSSGFVPGSGRQT